MEWVSLSSRVNRVGRVAHEFDVGAHLLDLLDLDHDDLLDLRPLSASVPCARCPWPGSRIVPAVRSRVGRIGHGGGAYLGEPAGATPRAMISMAYPSRQALRDSEGRLAVSLGSAGAELARERRHPAPGRAQGERPGSRIDSLVLIVPHDGRVTLYESCSGAVYRRQRRAAGLGGILQVTSRQRRTESSTRSCAPHTLDQTSSTVMASTEGLKVALCVPRLP